MKTLPKSIRTEVTFRENIAFIQKVKLFQLSNVSFIVPLLCSMNPIICMAGDYIVRVGELADSMYFIKQGIVRVLYADDETSTISYIGEGGYFGEIGLLLNGKRSTSVIAHTDCILFSISKKKILPVLNEFEQHKKFLELVAKQRLKTTYKKDNKTVEHEENSDEESNLIINEKATLQIDKSPTEKELRSESPIISELSFKSNIKETSNFKTYLLIWDIIVLLAIIWNAGYTFFALCFENIVLEHKILITIDIFFLIIYLTDVISEVIFEQR